MAQHATIVCYLNSGDSLDAFHVYSINTRRLQAALNDRDIHAIRHITIENEAMASRSFNTLHTESDIKKFLDKWKIDF